MGLVIVFIVSTICFVLAFRFVGAVAQFTWTIIWHGNENYVVLGIFVAVSAYLFWIL